GGRERDQGPSLVAAGDAARVGDVDRVCRAVECQVAVARPPRAAGGQSRARSPGDQRHRVPGAVSAARRRRAAGHGRTGGNPFFLEESVRSLIETRALVGLRGAYRPAQALHTLPIPPTVSAVLATRIDKLPSEDKQVLQAAAVIGKDVPFVL